MLVAGLSLAMRAADRLVDKLEVAGLALCCCEDQSLRADVQSLLAEDILLPADLMLSLFACRCLLVDLAEGNTGTDWLMFSAVHAPERMGSGFLLTLH